MPPETYCSIKRPIVAVEDLERQLSDFAWGASATAAEDLLLVPPRTYALPPRTCATTSRPLLACTLALSLRLWSRWRDGAAEP